MKLTTEAIIKMLPFEMEFKKQLIDGWADLSSDQKYEITMLLWDAYTSLYELTFQKNLDQALVLGQEGKEKMDTELYDRIKAKTEQEIQQLGSAEASTVDLSSTREELSKILNQDQTSVQNQTPQQDAEAQSN